MAVPRTISSSGEMLNEKSAPLNPALFQMNLRAPCEGRVRAFGPRHMRERRLLIDGRGCGEAVSWNPYRVLPHVRILRAREHELIDRNPGDDEMRDL